MPHSEKTRQLPSLLLTFAIAIAVALFLRLFVFELVRVEGPSMQPTLEDDELLFVEKVSMHFGDPARYDVVICHYDDSNTNYVKRIIGLPGETISIVGGKPYMNGEPLQDDVYGSGLKPHDMDPVTIPEDCVFVMGDNRANSMDSVSIGPIQKKYIVGHALFIVWPFSQIGGL